MNDQAKQSSWITRSEREWAMPVCMQPRAVAKWRFVEVRTNRPLSLTNDVYRLRVGQNYQLRIGCASDGTRPASVTLLSGPLTPVAETDQPAVCQDKEGLRCLCRIPEPESRRWLKWWAGPRFEPATVRVSYADGRAAYEQRIPIVTRPSRTWAVSLIVILALLLLGLPAACNLVGEYASVPPALQPFMSACSREDLGVGLAAAAVALGIGLLCLDNLRVRSQTRRYRNSQRKQVFQRLQLTQR
jgi:hypothetical protein